MKKTARNKLNVIAEAVVWGLFIVSSGLGSLSLLKLINLNDQAQAYLGYSLAAFAGVAFGYLTFTAIKNKG